MVSNGEFAKEDIVLWANAHQLSNGAKIVRLCVVTRASVLWLYTLQAFQRLYSCHTDDEQAQSSYASIASSSAQHSSEHMHCCGFSSSIMAEQGSHL